MLWQQLEVRKRKCHYRCGTFGKCVKLLFLKYQPVIALYLVERCVMTQIIERSWLLLPPPHSLFLSLFLFYIETLISFFNTLLRLFLIYTLCCFFWPTKQLNWKSYMFVLYAWCVCIKYGTTVISKNICRPVPSPHSVSKWSQLEVILLKKTIDHK